MRRMGAAAGSLLAVLLLSGCATQREPAGGDYDTIRLSMLSSGSIMLDGIPVLPQQLGRKLKRMGATPSTCIKIAVPDNAPKAALSELTVQLATAGFRRILFVRPRHADASLGEDVPMVPPTPSPR